MYMIYSNYHNLSRSYYKISYIIVFGGSLLIEIVLSNYVLIKNIGKLSWINSFYLSELLAVDSLFLRLYYRSASRLNTRLMFFQPQEWTPQGYQTEVFLHIVTGWGKQTMCPLPPLFVWFLWVHFPLYPSRENVSIVYSFDRDYDRF